MDEKEKGEKGESDSEERAKPSKVRSERSGFSDDRDRILVSETLSDCRSAVFGGSKATVDCY